MRSAARSFPAASATAKRSSTRSCSCGLVLAGLFGVGLWQTLDNFSLHPESPGSSVMVVKDEDLGSIIGLGTLAVYGYGIQDALNGATQYNKNHYLTFSIGLQPRPGASLAFRF